MANPDFQWASFYYPQILQALAQFKAAEWPEHTETDPVDPVIQLLRLFALVGHMGSVRLDHVAREQYLTTLRLRSSMIGTAALVDYRLAPPTPADVDVVADLNSPATSGTAIVRSLSRFATGGSPTDPPIPFEYLGVVDLTLTQDSGAYGLGSYLANATIPQALTELYDHTGAELGAVLFQGSGDLPAVNRGGLLFFHPELMFSGVAVDVDTPSADVTAVRWEYYDDKRIGAPDSVSDEGGAIGLDVTTLVGQVNPSVGLDVLVTCLPTGRQQWLQTITASGRETLLTSGTLGQTTVSTNPSDYTVQTFWPEVPGLVDGTAGLSTSGEVTWTLPQAVDRRWALAALEGANGTTITAHVVRARINGVGGTTAPDLDASTEPPAAVWSVLVQATQGRTYADRVGTTDTGSASQAFDLPRSPLIEINSVVLSDGEWAQVRNFLTSTSFDRHYTLTELPDGTQRITFGNGASGKIPPITSPVTVTYRVGADRSGNVGPLAVERDRTGNGKLKGVHNPRAAVGWVVQEGTTEQSLDLTRAAIPASIRSGDRAVTPPDIEALAVAFRTSTTDQVAERALALQEGNGPKTIALVVSGPGGIAPTQTQLDELDDYFNGSTVGLQRVGGVLLSNTELTAEAFTPAVIDVTATVTVLSDYSSGAQARITAALEAQLSPAAKRLVLDENGVWIESDQSLWSFGGLVSLAFLITTIATAIGGITNVQLALPTVDRVLGTKELPVPGTILISIVVL